MSVDRRKLFALGGLGAYAGVAGKFGPELDPSNGGITIRIWRSTFDGWMVAVPDMDYVNSPAWRPGDMVPVTAMKLSEYLAALERPVQST